MCSKVHRSIRCELVAVESIPDLTGVTQKRYISCSQSVHTTQSNAPEKRCGSSVRCVRSRNLIDERSAVMASDPQDVTTNNHDC